MFGQHLHKSQLFGNWTFAPFSSLEWRNGSQNWNVLEKLSEAGPFWKFWLFGHGVYLVMVFSLTFFFFFFLGGSDPGQICGSVRFGSGQTGQTSGGWRHWWRHAKLPARAMRVQARETEAVNADVAGGAWRRVAWRLAWNFQVLQIGGRRTPWYSQFSKIMGRFAQIWRTRPRIVASLWWRVEARAWIFGPEIFRFGRSWAVEDLCRLSFVKLWTDLHSFGD